MNILKSQDEFFNLHKEIKVLEKRIEGLNENKRKLEKSYAKMAEQLLLRKRILAKFEFKYLDYRDLICHNYNKEIIPKDILKALSKNEEYFTYDFGMGRGILLIFDGTDLRLSFRDNEVAEKFVKDNWIKAEKE